MVKKISAAFQRLFLFTIFVICFLLPFQPGFLATVEILTVIFFLLGHSPVTIFKNLKRQKNVLIFFLFFVAVAVSCFLSEDKAEANRQLEVKLPFVIIPLLLWGSGIGKENAKKAVIFFIAGCASACITLIVWAFYDYWQTGNSLVFLYTEFSGFMHVTYFSMYLLLCFGWLFMLALEDKLLYPKTHYFLMLLYAVCLILMAAKIMLLAFICSSFLFGGYYAWRKKKMGTALAIMMLIAVSPIALYFVSPNVKIRVDAVFEEIRDRDKPIHPTYPGSTELRIAIWSDAWPQIVDNLPAGTGVGDVKNMLLENYKKRGLTVGVNQSYNMHSEYLQQLAGLGITGFLFFIIISVLPAVCCRAPYRFIGILFSFTVLTASLTESILERQAGTIFICLVGILLMITYGKEPKAPAGS